MVRNLMMIGLALVTSGCATRSAMDISCPGFENYRVKLGKSGLEQDIHNSAGDEDQSDIDTLRSDMRSAVNGGPLGTSENEAVLLLSGGGQWGSYGAGFLGKLNEKRKLPDFRIITGVSTGGLQSLFLAVGSDEALDALRAAYAPGREKDIVNRNAKALTAITGSMAGLKPLKKRIEQALCADTDRACMLDRISHSGRHAYIGFVEARSGDFFFADATRLAAIPDRKVARECVTGIALASAAMPVFFQQVRINGRTYYDGGVRQSVFEARITRAAQTVATERVNRHLRANSLNRATLPTSEYSRIAKQAALPIYVVRNGPTIANPDATPDTKGDAITNALRAESIIVNQLEVSSIAALRLENPLGPIYLTTADGYNQPLAKPDGTSVGTCRKQNEAAMFEPSFMTCLAQFGRAKAERNVEWIALRELNVSDPGSDR